MYMHAYVSLYVCQCHGDEFDGPFDGLRAGGGL